MSKILFVLILVYVIYKIGKNATYLMMENTFGKKSLNKPEELLKCDYCERFISEELAIKHKSHYFCSDECVDASKNKPS